MGMEQSVTFDSREAPSWPAVRDYLGRHGLEVQLRMIDGQLAFPDEEPVESWRELRIGASQGMVTMQREPERVRLVVWGNADAGLRQLWNALAWGCAVVGTGTIQVGDRTVAPEAFAREADLPAGFTPAD